MISRDPIIAIATAPGRAAIGIVRVSGQHLSDLIEALTGRTLHPRQATYLAFRDTDAQPIDHGLALFFPAPHSFTGEDVLELQAHGGPVLLQLLLTRCLQAATEPQPATGQPRLPGLRLARPGEFSERAFLNGKIDLAQAEGIADLIAASTEAAARSASRSLSGEFSGQIQALCQELIGLRVLIEATLDFPEEEIDVLRSHDVHGKLSKLQQMLAAVWQRSRQGALLREGLRVVLAGQPNAGKSSLLNALAGAELAIVTPQPGTTRDVVQHAIQIDGVPLHIIDTAGLRQSDELVEQIGMARTWDQIAQADLVLLLHDLTRLADPIDATEMIVADAALASAISEKSSENVPVIEVWNKLDALEPAQAAWVVGVAAAADLPDPSAPQRGAAVYLSAKTGQGLEALRRQMLHAVGWQAAPEGLFLARARHLQALRQMDQHLTAALAHLSAGALELLAEELRLAQVACNGITGEFTPDDLLGAIFSTFCIGK